MTVCHCIDVEAGKFLGMRRIFAQISPNLPEKLQKIDCISFHVGRIFSTQSTSSTIFAQIYLNSPEKKQKKRLHFDVGCHFCEINAHTAILRRYSHILPKFLQILPGFSPNQNLWGCDCTPCTPASYTSVPLH